MNQKREALLRELDSLEALPFSYGPKAEAVRRARIVEIEDLLNKPKEVPRA